MAQQERELPLFPLGAVVLFPGMPLPLQVFEERYKLMLSDIRNTDLSFGVVLIQEGTEVGAPALPHQVGTVARLDEEHPTDDGRILLTALGEQRFRILQTLREQPYIIARVELLESEEGAQVPEELVADSRKAFQEYVQTLMVLRGGWANSVDSPPDPAELSYAIGGALQIDPLLRQQLLEAPGPGDRLESELPLLREATTQIREMLQQGRDRGRFGQN